MSYRSLDICRLYLDYRTSKSREGCSGISEEPAAATMRFCVEDLVMTKPLVKGK